MNTADQHEESTDADGKVFTAQLVILGVVLLTALYAPQVNSDRAFRIMDRMWGNS
jgi:hypothetical protein